MDHYVVTCASWPFFCFSVVTTRAIILRSPRNDRNGSPAVKDVLINLNSFSHLEITAKQDVGFIG